MRFYIRASEYSQDDIDFFELPQAFCQRIKNYIIKNEPEKIPEDEYMTPVDQYDFDLLSEDFSSDLCALQKIFDTKEELISYLQSELADKTEAFKQARLGSVLDKLAPQEEEEISYTQKTPYAVSGYDINTDETPFEDLEFKDPRSAIIAWFEQSVKHPMGVSIDAATLEDAQKLLKWVADNEDQFRTWYNEYDIPYKLEYLVNYCKRHQNDSNLIAFSGDQVEPFSLG